MVEYHECARVASSGPGSDSGHSVPLPAVGNSAQPPAYTTIAEQYGLQDMHFESASGSGEDQSVKQEFQAYVTAPLSPLLTNILKHWKVRIFCSAC
jgi:hypothetical protein